MWFLCGIWDAEVYAWKSSALCKSIGGFSRGFGFQKRKNSESVWLYKDLNEYDTYSDTEDVKHQENGYFLINAVDGSIMY